MASVLRIDSSARTARSITRRLGDSFLAEWMMACPGSRIVTRDVGQNPPPFIDEVWIAGAFAHKRRTPEQEAALALSEELIDEVTAADLIVITSPMYNYGMPGALKAWFDQVIRIHRTFSFDLARGDRPIEPTLGGKVLVLLTCSGEFGFEPGGINEGAGHLVPHVRTCAKYLGVEHTECVGVEYQEFGDARHEASLKSALSALAPLARRLAVRIGSVERMTQRQSEASAVGLLADDVDETQGGTS